MAGKGDDDGGKLVYFSPETFSERWKSMYPGTDVPEYGKRKDLLQDEFRRTFNHNLLSSGEEGQPQPLDYLIPVNRFLQTPGAAYNSLYHDTAQRAEMVVHFREFAERPEVVFSKVAAMLVFYLLLRTYSNSCLGFESQSTPVISSRQMTIPPGADSYPPGELEKEMNKIASDNKSKFELWKQERFSQRDGTKEWKVNEISSAAGGKPPDTSVPKGDLFYSLKGSIDELVTDRRNAYFWGKADFEKAYNLRYAWMAALLNDFTHFVRFETQGNLPKNLTYTPPRRFASPPRRATRSVVEETFEKWTISRRG